MSLLLMTPGPTRVPEPVLAAGAMAMLHHRTPEFSAILTSCIERLKPLFGTEGDLLPIHATGRGALEAAVTNLLSPGDEVVACCNGRFGDMWAGIAERFGITAHRVCCDWNAPADASMIAAAVAANPCVRAVLLVHSDTSNGALNDLAEVVRALEGTGALVMVDAVSSLGGVPFRFDEWGLDVAITASQKCLMSSPGMSFVALSPRAWQAQESSRMPRFYFDFSAVRSALSKAQPGTPGTTPVHLVAQIHAAVSLILEEGIENVFARHRDMACLLRSGIRDLGLSMQCPGIPDLSPTVTAITVPPAITPQFIRDQLRLRGIVTARGLGSYESTSFRIGHMGDIRAADVRRTLDAMAEIVEAAP